MKVSQTRLERRSHRPEIENCNDTAHIKMVEEVGTIHQTIDQLNAKLAEAQEAKADLLSMEKNLQTDIGIKTLSLRIDKHKCLGIR